MPEPLTPYDTGQSCEPRLWQPDTDSVRAAMRADEHDDIGKVDFDDDCGETVAAVHIERNVDGSHTLHLTSFVEADQLRISRDDDPLV